MTLLAVPCDIDGTLVDSEPLHHHALVAATLDLDVDFSGLADQAFRGIHIGDVWIALHHRLPNTLPEDQWLADIEACYANTWQTTFETLSAIDGRLKFKQVSIKSVFVRLACYVS